MRRQMTITCILLTVALPLLAPTAAQAEIVALKRDSALCTEAEAETWGYENRDALHEDFWAVESATAVTVKDSPLFNLSDMSNGDWHNYGAATYSPAGRFLISFDLSSLGTVTSVAKAQLRIAKTGAVNSSLWISRITSTDWDEGVGGALLPTGHPNGDYPTEANPGATWAHPKATSHSLPYKTGWDGGGIDDYTRMLDETASGSDMATHINGSFASAASSFLVFDMTDMVKEWLLDGESNFGAYVFHDGGNWPSMSESNSDTSGTTLNPVLFIDYVPEPATMGLLGLGFAGMAALRRRRRRA